MNIVRQTTQAYRIVWKDTFRIHETSDKSIAVVELSPRVTADSGFLAIVSLLTPVRSQGVPRRHSPTYVPERGTYEATRCDAPSMVSARMVLDRLDYGQVIEHSPIPVKK